MAVTVTILFTDLVGSTAVASALGPSGAEALRKDHFALLREAITASGGKEVKNLGDGVMVAFASVGDAVGCAVAMQQAMDLHRLRPQAPPMAIRVGISLGDATQEDDDYFGVPVVEAARLCATAQAGQILCTGVVRELVGGRRARQFEPVGRLSLKGLPEPVTAWSVSWEPQRGGLPLPPGVRVDFPGPLVGREEPLAVLDVAWRAAVSGRGGVVLVAGGAGIGKTRLAVECALGAHGEGATVLVGRCDEDLGRPYQALAEAIGHYVAVAPEAVLASLGNHVPVLARLVPELSRRLSATGPTDGAGAGSEGELERYQLSEAVAAVFVTAARHRPTVVVLDDLQWADRPALAMLRHVARAVVGVPLLIIAVYRDDCPGTRVLADALTGLFRLEGVHHVRLEGLGAEDVVRLTAAVTGRPLTDMDMPVVQALARETQGNPYPLGELLRHLADHHEAWDAVARSGDLWDLGPDGIPDSVHRFVRAYLSSVSDTGGGLLPVATVLGGDVDPVLLRHLADVDEATVEHFLAEAMTAGVLTPTPVGLVFRSGLVRRVLYDELPVPRRAHLHRQAAEYLEAGGTGRPGALARHWYEATRTAAGPIELGRAQRSIEHAAAEAMADGEYAEAVVHYRHAVEIKERTDTWSARHAELLLLLGAVEWRSDQEASARNTFRQAADIARRLGDPRLLGRAALGYGAGPSVSAYVAGADETLVGLLEEALAAFGQGERADDAVRVRVLARLAVELHVTGFVERRDALSREAHELAQRLDDPGTELVAVHSRLLAMRSPDELDARTAGAGDVVARADVVGDREMAFRGRQLRMRCLLESGELAAADSELEHLGRLAAELRQPFFAWQVSVFRGMRALYDGRLEDAEAQLGRAAETGRRSGSEMARRVGTVQSAVHRWLAGPSDEVVPLLREGTLACPWLALHRAGLAFGLAELGRRTEAAAEFESLARDAFAAVPRDGNWLLATGFLAFTAADLGDVQQAALLHDALRPYAGRYFVSGDATLTWGPVATALGVTAAVTGRYADALVLLEPALARDSGGWIRPDSLMARREYARVLFARRRPGDVDRAVAALDDAMVDARRHGYDGLVKQLAALRASMR